MLRAICMSCWEKYCAVRSGAFLRRKTQTGFLLWQKWTTFHRTRNCDFIITLAFEHIFLVLLIAKRSFQSVCVHFEQSAKLKIFSLASTTANLADLNALPYTKLMPLFCTCSCVFLVCELYGQFFLHLRSWKTWQAKNLESPLIWKSSLCPIADEFEAISRLLRRRYSFLELNMSPW